MKPTLARSAGRRGQRATLDPIEKSPGYGRIDDIDDYDISDTIKFELSDDDDDDDVLEVS